MSYSDPQIIAQANQLLNELLHKDLTRVMGATYTDFMYLQQHPGAAGGLNFSLNPAFQHLTLQYVFDRVKPAIQVIKVPLPLVHTHSSLFKPAPPPSRLDEPQKPSTAAEEIPQTSITEAVYS